MINGVLLYGLVLNIIGFFMMYLDKEKAKKGKYRIPEATLWKVALIGGAVGTSLGMKWFNHKTKVNKFKYGFPALAVIDSILIICYLVF